MIGIGALVLAIGIPVAVTKYHAWQDEAAYQEQLRLARQEGLPTNAAEYAAIIRPAEPAENAALIYRRLAGTMRGYPDFSKLDLALTFHATPQTRSEAKQALVKYKSALDLADQAVVLPRCWFDRNWAMGAAVLFHEFADMKAVAKLLALRGSVAANEGRSEDAIAEAKRIFTISKHLREEPHEIARLVSESVSVIAKRSLAGWAYTHRDQPEYRLALVKSMDELPKPSLKEEHRNLLVDALSMIELCSTREGREELGLKEDDLPHGAEMIFPLLLSQSKARAEIVRAARASWAALELPPSKRKEAFETATHDLYTAMLAFPTALSIYEQLSSGNLFSRTVNRELNWEAGRQQYLALARALEGPKPPASIKTNDLLSPFDGKPISYKFDGKQIVLSVSGYMRYSPDGPTPVVLKVPPDNALK